MHPSDNPDVLQNHSVRIIEHFNTNEEGYLFVPQDAQIEEGEQYVFDDRLSSPTEDELAIFGLVRVQYRPLTGEDLLFELETEEDFEILDNGGGEAAVHLDNFFSSAPFTITSGPQGWVSQDIEQSGLFTDYNTVHAKYFGTNNQFLSFSQEGAETEEGELDVMRDESEIFDPEDILLLPSSISSMKKLLLFITSPSNNQASPAIRYWVSSFDIADKNRLDGRREKG